MSGTIAGKIANKMVIQCSAVKRGFTSPQNEISKFSGYLDALNDTGFITGDELAMFQAEFIRLVLEA